MDLPESHPALPDDQRADGRLARVGVAGGGEEVDGATQAA